VTLSDPRQPAQVFTRLAMRQTALSASGIRKADHIRDPRTGEPVRGRLAAWAALPRPQRPAGTAVDPAAVGPRLAPGAVADALTTAFMLLPVEDIEALCQHSPGLEAWVLADGGAGAADLLHLTGPAPEASVGHSA
jgi:thiamine biosynthesis lipoprotein ApbE